MTGSATGEGACHRAGPGTADDDQDDAAGATAAKIGLVLVTHGPLAQALVAALEHIVGPQQAIASISIAPDDDVERRRADILDAIGRVSSGRGCIVMTDMFGGTPSNLALTALGREGVEVIAGVNLPMLVKFASVRASDPLAEVVRAVQEAGRKYISVASSFLANDGRK